MRCPRLLGLMTRAKIMFAMSPNVIRIMLPDDSEIDLVLIDCFTPPTSLKTEHRRLGTDERAPEWKVRSAPKPVLFYDKEVPNPAGVRAFEVTRKILSQCPEWTRVLIPTPQHDREWFRNLKPQSKQPGHLWISEHQTLSERLVELGIATKTQPQDGASLFDGTAIRTSQEDPALWSFSPN